jgi:small subunit ribosomal protein S20
MANTKSAQKAMRQSQRHAVRNQAARSAVRTFVKKATLAVAGSVEDAAEVVRAAVSALDKAAKNGLVHRNAAARRKSRLMSRLHALSLSPDETPKAETRTKAAPAKATAKKATATTRTATEKKPTTARKPAARKPAAKKA